MAESAIIASAEAEMAVIGGALTAPVKFADIAEVVSADDFASELNRRIFGAMAAMATAGQPIDLLTVAEWMEARGSLRDGDWAHIGVAQRDTPSAANVLAYARIVRDRALRRKLLRLATDLQAWAWRDDAETALAKLGTALEAVAGAAGSGGGPVPLRELLVGVIDEIDRRFVGAAPKGMTTGLADLDRLTLGLHDGDLVVVAGRPGMGKSVFGLQMALRVAAEHRRPALFCTAEMPSRQQVERLIASAGSIDLGRIRSGALGDDDWSRLTSAVVLLSDAPLWLDETPLPRLDDLLAKARRLHRQHGPLGLVVVDHAGLVETGGENRQQAQAAIGRALKALAKELSCPVMALVQLNRALEQRADRRPLMSDLRDSGEWEQSADAVLAIYRDEVYDERSPDAGCAELLVRKNRGGKLGVVPLAFQGEFSRFGALLGELPSRSGPAPARSARERGIDL